MPAPVRALSELVCCSLILFISPDPQGTLLRSVISWYEDQRSLRFKVIWRITRFHFHRNESSLLGLVFLLVQANSLSILVCYMHKETYTKEFFYKYKLVLETKSFIPGLLWRVRGQRQRRESLCETVCCDLFCLCHCSDSASVLRNLSWLVLFPISWKSQGWVDWPIIVFTSFLFHSSVFCD